MERIGEAVERELARGGSRDALPLAAVTASWRDAVGEAVARNAWPSRLGRDGTLHVTTSSAAWAFELDRLGPEISARLAEKLGRESPEKLRFAVGPVPEPESSPRPADEVRSPREASAEVSAAADSAASAIEDPELRELVARAARASLSNRPSDRRF